MPWYPKAIRREITKHRTPMAAYRRLVLHTAVSSASSLYEWHLKVSHCSHFYLRHDGVWEQYVDTRFRAPNQFEGNPDSISVESQDMGGPFPSWSGSNVPAWTAKQLEAIAELAVWLNETHGIPLVQLPNSKPGTRGIGWHRQGIDGNFPGGILAGRVSGGEKWSDPGKVCPGDRRIKQVPGIIARARQLTEEDDMPSADEVADKVLERIVAHRWPRADGNGDAGFEKSVDWARQHAGDVKADVRNKVLPGQAAILAAIAGEDVQQVLRAELDAAAARERTERQQEQAALVGTLGPVLVAALQERATDLDLSLVTEAVEDALGRVELGVRPADDES